MIKTPKKVEILSCFSSEDDFGGDYEGIEVAFDGKAVATFGDHYHDRGFDKAEGFIEGVAFALGKKLPKTEYRDVVRENLYGKCSTGRRKRRRNRNSDTNVANKTDDPDARHP